MTKEKLQAEIKEKVKPGIKPSQLKKSRSLGDIPQAPPLPGKSVPELEAEKQILADQLTRKQKELEELRAKLESAQAELAESKKASQLALTPLSQTQEENELSEL